MKPGTKLSLEVKVKVYKNRGVKLRVSKEELGALPKSALELLEQVDQIIAQGKTEEAMKIIEGREKEEGIVELRWRIAESKCRNRKGEFEQVIEITEEIIKELEELEEHVGQRGESARKRIRIDALIEQVRALQRRGKLDEGLEKVEEGIRFIEELEEREETEEKHKDKERKANLLNNEGNIYLDKGELDQALDTYEKSLEIREEMGNKLDIAGSLNNIGLIYLRKGELDKAMEYHKKSLVIKKELGNKRDIAGSLNNIGVIYLKKGELAPALEYYEKTLTIFRELGDKRLIALLLNNIGVIYLQKGELNHALEYIEKSLTIRETLGPQQEIADSLNNIGIIYRLKGELAQALDYYEKTLAIRKEVGNKQLIACSLQNIGELYQEMGELETALDLLKQSLVMYKEIGNNLFIAYLLFRLIDVTIDIDIKEAREYLSEMQLINEEEENKLVDLYTRLAEALVLKTSKRRMNLTKAEEILEEIVEEAEKEMIEHQLTVKALVNLSELLLDELLSTGEEEILEEVEGKVDKLMEVAKKQQSYSLITESYLLKAQLALVRLNLKDARSLLSQAQLIAEEKGLEKLARKISSEHDQLLEQLDQWEELIAKDASITERVKVANLEELVRWMARKREIIIDETDDEPVMVLLVAESGLPIYSKHFDPARELKDMLISGFLTSINTFVQEAFDTPGRIKRIMHDDYTLSFDLVDPILFCYVYEGQSYTAMKKLEKLMTEVHESEVWSALEEVGKKGYKLNYGEIAQLEGMMGEIFTTN